MASVDLPDADIVAWSEQQANVLRGLAGRLACRTRWTWLKSSIRSRAWV